MTGKRDDVVRIARAELGVREATGNNDGPRVEEYLAYTGFKKGNPYCASYVSWCFHKAGYSQPKTAWSPALFPASRLTKDALPGNVFGIWFPELNRIAHVGLLERLQGDFLLTLEGNTNVEGSREGQGVYRRMRHKRTVKAYADWIILKQ
ncbi:peptidoglycan-binding protein [Pedobacter heparinus]|uniref:peptidoglycan-binding protein n=1 Tax=Pedobacter heparinus TaxID=984 RepID=UPI0029312298|nr:peptidoglycan-binding protein [Pedobacter heparinus]